MKLAVAVAAISMALVFGTYAEVKKDDQAKKEITKPETKKEMKMSELPTNIQEAIKKECEGKVTSIRKVEVNKSTYYKVTANLDNRQKIYVFDKSGKKHE